MERMAFKAEVLLRVISVVMALLTALLLKLNSETETVFFVNKKATVKDLTALWDLVIIGSVVASYNLLQICRCFAVAWLSKKPCGGRKFVAWLCFLLDQGATYTMFAGSAAATQASMISVVGVSHFQWSKVCNIYTRFCHQVAGALLCGLSASLAMVIISSISAHHLFKLYPASPRPLSANAR